MSALSSARSRWFRWGTVAALAALGSSGVAIGDSDVGSAAVASTVTVQGIVYYDKNNNGVQDPGEPGLAGLAVATGSNPAPAANHTLTDSSGFYTLSVPSTTNNLVAGIGWFESHCPATRNCNTDSAGNPIPGVWAMSNQLLKLTVGGVNRTANLGLVPDWPDTPYGLGPIPTPVGGVVPANGHDLAVRLSSAGGTCTDGASSICAAGDTFGFKLQLQNQGTVDVTNPVVAVSVPSGDCITAAPVLEAGTAPVGLTGLSVSPTTADCTANPRLVTLSFAGTLEAGSQVNATFNGQEQSGPGTPGCVRGAPVAPCSTAEPQARSWQTAIVSDLVGGVQQTGDDDSQYCKASPAFCATGIHDKRFEPDDVDVAGHNVVSSLAGSTAFDLKVDTALARSQGTFHAGQTLRFRTAAINAGPNQANAGWTVTLTFPLGSNPVIDGTQGSLPSGGNDVIIRCADPVPSVSAITVVCTGKGPVAAGVWSSAMDVLATIPSSATGSNFTVTAQVASAPGQAGETSTTNNSDTWSKPVT